MQLLRPKVQILTPIVKEKIYSRIELAARTCYKSEKKMTDSSAERMIRHLVRNGHGAMIEHSGDISVKFIVDRGVSHELVRHRLCSFAQESTRYCDYSGEVSFIIPPWVSIQPGSYASLLEVISKSANQGEKAWVISMFYAEQAYKELARQDWSEQQARAVLPNSLKTEIIVTANLREWQHIIKLRAAGATGRPHPQMLEVMLPLWEEFRKELPELFTFEKEN